MPRPLWFHDCPDKGKSWHPTAECPECGVIADFSGWHLTLDESHARYEYILGLKALGPHRDLADMAVRNLGHRCERCQGFGTIPINEAEDWRMCPDCEGTGGFWRFSEEDVAAIRDAILRRFPDAVASTDRFLPFARQRSDHA